MRGEEEGKASLPAPSIASVILLVESTITLAFARSRSSCVSKAFTARTASLGSDPETAALRAAVSDSTSSMRTRTSSLGSSQISAMRAKRRATSRALGGARGGAAE